MLLTLDYHFILFIRENILGVSGLEEVQLVHCIEYLTVGGWKLTFFLWFINFFVSAVSHKTTNAPVLFLVSINPFTAMTGGFNLGESVAYQIFLIFK